jgi:hypothetical protein
VKGFADLHNHQFAYLGFGGLMFHGRAFGNVQQALPWCTPVHGPGGMGAFLGDFIFKTMYGSSFLGHLVGCIRSSMVGPLGQRHPSSRL